MGGQKISEGKSVGWLPASYSHPGGGGPRPTGQHPGLDASDADPLAGGGGMVAAVDEKLLEEAVEGGAGVPVRGREVQVLQVQHQVVGPRPGRRERVGGWRPSGLKWGMCRGPAYTHHPAKGGAVFVVVRRGGGIVQPLE